MAQRVESLLAMLEGDATNYQRHFNRNVQQRNPAVGTAAELWIVSLFSAGLIRWRAGTIASAKNAFERCVAAYSQRQQAFSDLKHVSEVREAFARCDASYVDLARVANYLVGGGKLEPPAPESVLPREDGDGLALSDAIVRYCVDDDETAIPAMERSKSLWASRGYTLSVLKEWDFYRSVLTGEWASRDPQAMFERHSQLFAARRKSKNGELLDGDGKFNDLVVDYIFAAVLKKIGWIGEYQHAWPEAETSAPVSPLSTTRVAPHIFSRKAAVESSRSKLASFRDCTVDEAIALVLGHASSESSGVEGREALETKDIKALSLFGVNPESRDYRLFASLRFEKLPTPHLGVPRLADVRELVERTHDLIRNAKMDPDLIVLSIPDSALQWDKPDRGEYVYRLSDGRVYLAEPEILAQGAMVERSVRSDITVWPSLASFLIWYVQGGLSHDAQGETGLTS